MPGSDLGNRVFKYESNTGDAYRILVCKVFM